METPNFSKKRRTFPQHFHPSDEMGRRTDRSQAARIWARRDSQPPGSRSLRGEELASIILDRNSPERHAGLSFAREDERSAASLPPSDPGTSSTRRVHSPARGGGRARGGQQASRISLPRPASLTERRCSAWPGSGKPLASCWDRLASRDFSSEPSPCQAPFSPARPPARLRCCPLPCASQPALGLPPQPEEIRPPTCPGFPMPDPSPNSSAPHACLPRARLSSPQPSRLSISSRLPFRPDYIE